MERTLTFELERDTKNTYRFQEDGQGYNRVTMVRDEVEDIVHEGEYGFVIEFVIGNFLPASGQLQITNCQNSK